MNGGGGYGASYGELRLGRIQRIFLSNMVTSFRDGRNLVGEGKMFIKDETKVASGVGEELCILSSCFLSPMSKN